MNKQEQLQLIRETRVTAIMRANRSESLISAAEAFRAGGVRLIEVSVTKPGALTVISEAAARFGEDGQFGAGGVNLDTAGGYTPSGAAASGEGGSLGNQAHGRGRRSDYPVEQTREVTGIITAEHQPHFADFHPRQERH